MEITEKWLGDIAGWQVLKAAKTIVDRGLVTDTKRDDTGVRGMVVEGPKRYQSGLIIRTKTDVENVCTCMSARNRGLICSHSIAVTLSLIRKPVAPPAAGEAPPPPTAYTRAGRTGVLPPPGKFFFFLPDNLLDATFKDQAAVFMRFEPGEGEPSDGAIAGWLKAQSLKPGSMPLMLTRSALAGLFNALGGHVNVFSGKASATPPDAARLNIADSTMRLPVHVTEVGADGVAFSLDSESMRRIANEWCYCNETRTFFPLSLVTEDTRQLAVELFTTQRALRTLSWLVRHRSELDDSMILRLDGPHLSALHLMPLPCEFELQIDGSLQQVEAKLHATFDHMRWMAMEGTLDEVNGVKFPLEARDTIGRFYSRNMDREKGATERLFEIGFLPMSSTTWRLQGQDKVARFYASELPRLQKVFKVDESQRWLSATKGVMRITPKVLEPAKGEDYAPGNNWLSLDIAYEAPDGFRISRAEVTQLIRSGRHGMAGPDGKRYLIDEESCQEFEESLRDLDSEMTPTGVRVRADKAQFLFSTDDATWAERQAAQWQTEDWVKEQLPDLAEILRPYQFEGIRWLEASARGAQAGLLADDMGLGKTLQAISLVRLLHKTADTKTAPTLIVCPKSLIANWEREFERFAPELNVLPIYGSDRKESFADVENHDAVITTYQLIVRDLTQHRKRTYSAIVLDEASNIKNPDTAAAKALRSLKADRRFALTGTPLENGVRDMWSIYHFLMPGYLGSRDSFKERFEKPLSGGVVTPDARKVSDRLRKLVRPYFLRRTKKEVLKDLPEKIEQILWCDLSRPQMEVYRRLLEQGHEEVSTARRRVGGGGAKMAMFTVLLRLRQVCCDLRMTGMDEAILKTLSTDDLSGKLAVWRERLDEIVNSGGKILIFSQFVKFLHLLRAELERDKVDFCYLDGQSNDRAAQVQRFQTDPKARVFLISLKAGGYGLNLTAADHVMLMDPWWNPAVEAQAIDRAHRLGQERVVTALRLVTRGTVEEKIIKLQSQKRGLIEAALDDSAPMMTGLTEEDLESVLS